MTRPLPKTLRALLKEIAGVHVLPHGVPDLALSDVDLSGTPEAGAFRLRAEASGKAINPIDESIISPEFISVEIERAASAPALSVPSARLRVRGLIDHELAAGLSAEAVDLTFELTGPRAWSVSGSLVANLFGRKIGLRVSLSALDGSAGLKFASPEEMRTRLVDLGETGSFTLTRIELEIEQRPGSPNNPPSTAFKVGGSGRLELRAPSPSGGAGSVILDGDLAAVAEGGDDRYLQLQFNKSTSAVSWSLLGARGGLGFTLSPRQLYFHSDDGGSVELEIAAGFALTGLPPAIQAALTDEALAEISMSERGLQIKIPSVFEPIAIPLPTIEPLGGGALIELGDVLLHASNATLSVGRDLTWSVELGLGLPQGVNQISRLFNQFNRIDGAAAGPEPESDLFETYEPAQKKPTIAIRVSARAEELQIQLLTSPFKSLKLTPQKDGTLEAHAKLGPFGDAFFTMPVLRLDWASHTLTAEGRFRYKDLRIPLAPAIELLKMGGLSSIAERLPKTIPLRPVDIAGASSALTTFLEDVLGKGAIGTRVREELEKLVTRLDRLPRRFRDAFLTIEVPNEFAFQIAIAPDLSASVSLSMPPAHGAAEREPLKLLLPILGPSGPELLGLTLYSLSLGQLLGGQLVTLQIDAELDRFELVPIALSMALAGNGDLLPPPEQLEQRILCRDVFSILVPHAGAPVPVPLFFKQIGLVYTGADGLEADVRWELPAPKLGLPELARAVALLRDFFLAWKSSGELPSAAPLPAHFRPALTVGPSCVRLPKYLGGQLLGSLEKSAPIDAPSLVEMALAALQKLDFDALLAVIPDEHGAREIDIDLGPEYRKALRIWSAMTEPAALLHADQGHTSAAGAPAGETRGLTFGERISRGFAMLSIDQSRARVRARLTGITSERLRFSTELTEPAEGAKAPVVFELRFDSVLDSAAALARALAV